LPRDEKVQAIQAFQYGEVLRKRNSLFSWAIITTLINPTHLVNYLARKPMRIFFTTASITFLAENKKN
jgi:hypothetical protein